MTLGSISLGLMQNPVSSTPYVPPSKKDWDILFQPMFDEYFQPSPSVVSRVPPTTTLIPADTNITEQGVEEQQQNAQFDNDPFINIFTPEPSSEESSSKDVMPSNLHQNNQPLIISRNGQRITRWTMSL
ncbi:hypothetical protein Tco_0513852 [Tanacetum coccineum]